jgi:L-iditol 2-dehydrogenase
MQGPNSSLPSATIVLLGCVQSRSPVTVDLSAAVRKGVSLFTSRGEGGNAVRRAVSLASRGRLRCSELISHRFALDEIAEAFRVLSERDGDPLKAAIVP